MSATPIEIPTDKANLTVVADGKSVALSNLNKVFWPKSALTKGDLLRYYARISPYLIPHVRNKPMVMKRYPNGIDGEFFFMKRSPAGKPAWVRTCEIPHGRGSIIAFPMVDDLASLLWIVNLGCIDLNPWYFSCDTKDQPEYLHFDLDPFDAPFSMVREAALIVRDALVHLGMKPFVKTSGSKGLHVYVGIEIGPSQHEVWEFAKALSFELASGHKDVLTAEYRIASRPRGRVLVDYNQNSFGRTLASIYSVRPTPDATVSTPVTWDEVEGGVEIGEFTMLNVVERVEEIGDLWKPLTQKRGRFNLRALTGASA